MRLILKVFQAFCPSVKTNGFDRGVVIKVQRFQLMPGLLWVMSGKADQTGTLLKFFISRPMHYTVEISLPGITALYLTDIP